MFSGWKEEVTNISANRSRGLPSRIPNRSEKHNLGRGLVPVKFRRIQPIRSQGDHLCFPIDTKKKTWWMIMRSIFRSNFVEYSMHRLQRRSWKFLSQSEAILVFRLARKTNFVEDVQYFIPAKYSVQWFLRSRKCEKWRTDGRFGLTCTKRSVSHVNSHVLLRGFCLSFWSVNIILSWNPPTGRYILS